MKNLVMQSDNELLPASVSQNTETDAMLEKGNADLVKYQSHNMWTGIMLRRNLRSTNECVYLPGKSHNC